ncbi:toll/interleukin-1 receptor domain-containing protein [Saccharothrix carnea]|uniref:toll/interleukin-1 receptor domain-containing protein n=1 Tax=Saccharothrix carnea TaxID=1280637 RepID=UPI0015E7747C|nr:toll/interleukin-1 receptor domain-containing protein [Saccharothrix carnea]
MSLVFINYRRRDDAYAAAFLDFFLSQRFGADQIFRAGRSIPAGEDYETCLNAAIDHCIAMLVVVGQDWPKSFDRSNASVDWVRVEISKALKRQIRVIPVLLSGVPRIRPEELPPELRSVSRFQYLRFDYRNTEQDLSYIASELQRSIPQLATGT